MNYIRNVKIRTLLIKGKYILILFYFTINFVDPACLLGQNKAVDSLKSIVENSKKHDTIHIKACIEIANQAFHSDVDIGFYYTNKALTILKSGTSSQSIPKVQKQNLEADAFSVFAEMYSYKGIMDSAVFYFEKAITIYEKNNKERKLANAFMGLGSILDYQTKNKEALLNYSKAQQLFEKLNDTSGIALSLNNLGTIYYGQGDTLIAIDYIERSIALNQKMQNYEQLMWDINNLGNIYLRKGNYSKSLMLFKLALINDKNVESKSGLAYTLKNLGNYYLKLKILDSALYYHQKDLELYTQLKNESGIALSNTNIGKVYFEKGDYKLAKVYGEKSYEITSVLNLGIRTFEVAGLLKDVYRKTNEYQKALYFTDLYVQIKDSMRTVDSERASLRQRMQYEYTQKELIANEQHKQELEISSEREQKQKILTYATGGGLGLVAIFLLFVFNRLRLTRKQNKIIEEQKTFVEKANHLLADKNREITDSITYAKRIQNALITNENYIEKHLKRLMKK